MRRLDIAGVPDDVRQRMGPDKLPLDRALTRTTALTDLSGRCALVAAASYIHGTTVTVAGGIGG